MSVHDATLAILVLITTKEDEGRKKGKVYEKEGVNSRDVESSQKALYVGGKGKENENT